MWGCCFKGGKSKASTMTIYQRSTTCHDACFCTYRGNDTIGLALPKGDLSAGLDHNVAGLTAGLGASDGLHRLDGGSEWLLVVEGVHGHLTLLQLEGHLAAGNLLGSSSLGHNRASLARGADAASLSHHGLASKCLWVGVWWKRRLAVCYSWICGTHAALPWTGSTRSWPVVQGG